MPPSRRDVLRATSTALLGSLAGCAVGGSSREEPSVTPAPVPTESPVPTPPRPSPDDVVLEVDVRRGFAPDHPARLEIGFTNAGDRTLVASDGPQYVVPFVDEDYAGEASDGSLGLFLVPDGAKLHVRPEGTDGGWVGEYLPEAPTDGCWRLPFDWPDARSFSTAILHVVDLAPGETVRHGYGLYWIDACEPGTYAFEHRFDLRYATGGETPAQPSLTATGFDLTVADDGGLSVDVREPVVGPPGAGR